MDTRIRTNMALLDQKYLDYASSSRSSLLCLSETPMLNYVRAVVEASKKYMECRIGLDCRSMNKSDNLANLDDKK